MSQRNQRWKGGEVSAGQGIPPVPVSKESLEEVIRVIKTGLFYHPVVSDTVKEALGTWATEREDELDTEAGRNLAEIPRQFRAETTEPMPLVKTDKPDTEENPVPLVAGGNE